MQKVRSQHHVQVGLVAGPGSFFFFLAFSLFHIFWFLIFFFQSILVIVFPTYDDNNR